MAKKKNECKLDESVEFEKTVTITLKEYDELIKIRKEVVEGDQIMVASYSRYCSPQHYVCFYTLDESMKILADKNERLKVELDEVRKEAIKFDEIKWEVQKMNKSFWRRLFYKIPLNY